MKLREMRSAKAARKKAIGAANGARLAQANANLKQNKKASFADELSQSISFAWLTSYFRMSNGKVMLFCMTDG